MTHTIPLKSDFQFDYLVFFGLLLDCDIRLIHSIEVERGWIYYFVREKFSHTYFILEVGENDCHLSIDPFASMDDHRIFPYLVDTLSNYLEERKERDEETPFQIYNEYWIEEHIAEGVAYLKCCLSISSYYYIDTYIEGVVRLSVEYLSNYGVSIHSSTPRIYGYVNYLLRNKKAEIVPSELVNELYDTCAEEEETELEVNVPQHISIAKVKSWQIDGTETFDSFAQEDVDLLLKLAERYNQGEYVESVVLNDIGTIFQEGVGVEKDGEKAVYWYRQAILRGEKYYAPVNLGDIYRKGCGNVGISLQDAFDAFMLSDDPYAYYRIGQAHEEGWLGEININLAMKWYERSAAMTIIWH